MNGLFLKNYIAKCVLHDNPVHVLNKEVLQINTYKMLFFYNSREKREKEDKEYTICNILKFVFLLRLYII